jgi:hypothetical protein
MDVALPPPPPEAFPRRQPLDAFGRNNKKLHPFKTENSYCHYTRFCYFYRSFASRLKGQLAGENGLIFAFG